ncbi:MAG: hypothetical protein JNL32_06005, partial [Candidatus Kapabacteria bacterium]|nr:hypothetical protein [Candidatus Kapabacteria bacterium]
SGKVLGTYEKENNVVKLKEVPLLGSSRLGMDRVDVVRTDNLLTATNIYTRTVGSKHYELTDHLGNVRAVVR